MKTRLARSGAAVWRVARKPSRGLLRIGTVGGFAAGLLIVIFRDYVIPSNFDNDSRKIVAVATDALGNFSDKSFTSVASVYRALGLIGHPELTAILSYLFAAVAIALALWRLRVVEIAAIEFAYLVAAFLLCGVYLGTYTKDVFILPITVLLIALPRRWWCEALIAAAMGGYAYWFRSYWVLVLVVYLAVRIILAAVQVGARYILLLSSLGPVLIGVVMYAVLRISPDHYREQTLSQTHHIATTTISPLVDLPEPLGGLVNVFGIFWLLLVPILLPVSAGAVFFVVTLGNAFIRLVPFLFASSDKVWPNESVVAGVILRRALAVSVGFLVVQALFEPDYGSALRHLTPLLPISIALILAAQLGVKRSGAARAWSLTGTAESAGKRGRRAR